MKKLFAIGAMLLSSSAVLVTPAAAQYRDDYRNPAFSYPSRLETQRADRLRERIRLERLRRERERQALLMRHRGWGY